MPLSATAATILNEYAKQVDPRTEKFAAPFAKLSNAEQGRASFQTVEALPSRAQGRSSFLVGNLPDLAAFLAYSARV